jgi:hypothetical protein
MNFVKVLALIILLLVIIAVFPLLTIAALNTLFALGIQYTLWTWLSVVWIQMMTFGGVAASARKS